RRRRRRGRGRRRTGPRRSRDARALRLHAVTLVYAHRGANRRAPENTLRAFALAVEEGADGVELDVRTCASGEVVVAHDAHLGRVGERAAWIAMLPWERVREVRVGEGERVPLLDEAIDLVVGAGLRLNVEVK